jgi:hypothetical protein
MVGFKYNYKPMNYNQAASQANKQLDPIYQNSVKNLNAQKYQNQLQAGGVAQARGLSHSGLAADQMTKVAMASQGQMNDLNAQKAAQTAQIAQEMMNRDQDVNDRRRAQAFGEYQGQKDNYYRDKTFAYQQGRDKVGDSQWSKTFGYQQGRDKVGDKQWNDQFTYQKGRDKISDKQWDSQFNFQKSQFKTEQEWRKYEFKNMSKSEKAALDWAKKQYGEDAAWRLYEMEYQGNAQISQNQATIDGYSAMDFLP